MADLNLRPLSLGELLDRTFTLYRQHFALFVGITAIPQLLILAFNLFSGFVPGVSPQPMGAPVHGRVASASVPSTFWLGAIVAIVIYLVVYLFAQGGTFFAVSEIYLGRATTIGKSLQQMRGHLINLLGVTVVNGLVVGLATLLLIIPGIYMACRLLTCVPAALFENLGPRDSIERSYTLTEDEAGRAFIILLLYFVLAMVAAMLFEFPFTLAAMLIPGYPGGSAPLWIALSHVGHFLGTVLVTPYLTIATAVFYYDLRVRREAFDLQLMMNAAAPLSPAPGAPPTLA